MALDIVKNTCGLCKYFSNPNDILGSCRRFPTYQNRHNTEWCGEYEQNAPLLVMDEIATELTKESIKMEVGNLRPKAGRPRKNA